MMESQTNNAFEQIVQKIAPQSKLLRSWALKGGVSAQVTALEIERPDGQIQKMIVRQHGAVDLKHNPQIAADEFKLLQLSQLAGLAVPIPYYVDLSNEIFPSPYVVIEYIEGESEFAPRDLDDFLLQSATYLSHIHQVDISNIDVSFLPNQAHIAAEVLQERPTSNELSFDDKRIRDVLGPAWPLPQRNASVLLHGDFWPGNMLWKHSRLVAVIDWEDARTGDPLSDLANSRREMLWAFGIDAMDRFTHQYRAVAPIDMTDLPAWDLYNSLGKGVQLGTWGLDEATEQRMRAELTTFIAQAFEKLAT